MAEQGNVSTNDVLAHARRACLLELTGMGGSAAIDGSRVLPGRSTTNELESKLVGLLRKQDGIGFLAALVASDVIVPTRCRVLRSSQIGDRAFPWLVFGGDDASVIPVFSSIGAMERLAVMELDSVKVPFADLVANWPSEEHVFCVNPGMDTELLLPGSAIAELADELEELLHAR